MNLAIDYDYYTPPLRFDMALMTKISAAPLPAYSQPDFLLQNDSLKQQAPISTRLSRITIKISLPFDSAKALL